MAAVLAPERAEQDPAPPAPGRRRPLPRPRRDVSAALPDDRRLSWVLTTVLGVVTLVSRLWGITYPKALLFDEAYYPPEAHELLTWGHEYNRGYSFIVHPPLGKWLIALGEQVFGYNSLGWRFPSAVAGTIAVVVLARLGRRLTGSTLLGLIAGLLLAVDGFSFTLARIGLLDVFLQTFVVSAVACLVVDRDSVRARVRAAGDRMSATGFRLGPRGWRIGAGFLFGCACAVKWSGVWFVAFVAVRSQVWDRAAWREAGVARPTLATLRRGVPGAAWALGAVPVLTYLASFTGWFLGETSQGKFWAQQHPHTAFPFVPEALR
jgi:dolichyl-phosphate-mannose--protein O-mannosyl transferase